jgi:hypothetical protein
MASTASFKARRAKSSDAPGAQDNRGQELYAPAIVIAPEVRFEGFTHEDWRRFLTLFEPLRPKGTPRSPDRPQGLLIAVHDEHGPTKLLHSKAGRLRLDDIASSWPLTAEELAHRHHASWTVVMTQNCLAEVMEQFGEGAHITEDLNDQLLRLLQLLQAQTDKQGLQLWPQRLNGVTVPTSNMVNASLDMICPAGKSILLGLFERGELYTSVALRRGKNGIDWIVGPDELRAYTGLLSGDFRRDHRHFARTASELVGPLALGCFAEYRAFRNLEVDPTPGAWAMAVALRDIVLYPAPAAMAVPLGIDAGRAAFSALRSVFARLDPAGTLTPGVGAIRQAILGDQSIEDLLGFQPMAILRMLLQRDD